MIESYGCQLLELYSFLGKKWTIQLLHNIDDKEFSFNELYNLTKHMISSRLLSARIKDMVNLRLIKKITKNNRIRYIQTTQCKRLKEHLHEIKQWAIDYNYLIPIECDKNNCKCNHIFNKKTDFNNLNEVRLTELNRCLQ